MNKTRYMPNDGRDLRLGIGVDPLIAALASHDGPTREHARNALVRIGERAVGSLIEALQNGEDQVRWEAAKALIDIASPKAAAVLVATLRDEVSGIRWLAAEALIALGPKSIEPLLQGLIEHSFSAFMCKGAHHVLHELVNGPLAESASPVLAALEGLAPECRAPVAAYALLNGLRKDQQLESDEPSSPHAQKGKNSGGPCDAPDDHC